MKVYEKKASLSRKGVMIPFLHLFESGEVQTKATFKRVLPFGAETVLCCQDMPSKHIRDVLSETTASLAPVS